MATYEFISSGTTAKNIYSAIECLRSARALGWDTSWWEEKANTLHIRSDQQATTRSEMHLLLSRATLTSLDQEDLHWVKLHNGLTNPVPDNEANPFGTAAGTTTYKGWVFREARSIDPSVEMKGKTNAASTPTEYSASPLPDLTPNPSQIVLVTFEDARCLFQGSSADRSYNHFYSAYHDVVNEAANPANNSGYTVVTYTPNTLNSSALWTWKQVLDDLRTNYIPNGSLIDTAGFSALTHSSTEVRPENLRCGPGETHKTPWDLFCAILEATGHTLTYDPTVPKFYVIPLSSTTSTTKTSLVNTFTTEAPNLFRVTNTRNPTGRNTFLPEKVRVVFPNAAYTSPSVSPIPQDAVEQSGTYVVDTNTSSLASGSITSVSGTIFTINAEGYLHRATTRFEQSSPSPANLRKQQLDSIAAALSQRYVTSMEINHTEWTLLGAQAYVADQYYPEYTVRFATYRVLDQFNESYNPRSDISQYLSDSSELFLACPETTVVSRAPFDWDGYTPQAQADSYYPHAKNAYVQVNQSGGIADGKLGQVYFLRPMPAVDTTPDPDELKWAFTGTPLDGYVINLTGNTLDNGDKFEANFDHRLGFWVVAPQVASNSGDTINVVTVYHSTLADGEAVDPQGSNRYFSGTLSTPADIWIEALDTIGNSDVRCQLPAGGKFLGLLEGTWDPDPEGTSDERPLYKIQPQHPGVVLAMVTAVGTAADWTTTTAPTVGSCTVQIYNYTEAGALEVFKTGVTAAYMAETAVTNGSIVYLGMFEGYWHVITQLCDVASGFSE